MSDISSADKRTVDNLGYCAGDSVDVGNRVKVGVIVGVSVIVGMRVGVYNDDSVLLAITVATRWVALIERKSRVTVFTTVVCSGVSVF